MVRCGAVECVADQNAESPDGNNLKGWNETCDPIHVPVCIHRTHLYSSRSVDHIKRIR